MGIWDAHHGPGAQKCQNAGETARPRGRATSCGTLVNITHGLLGWREAISGTRGVMTRPQTVVLTSFVAPAGFLQQGVETVLGFAGGVINKAKSAIQARIEVPAPNEIVTADVCDLVDSSSVRLPLRDRAIVRQFAVSIRPRSIV